MVIAENDQYEVTRPRNEWDMNYVLYDKENKVEYLIDMDDVYEDGSEDAEGITISELVSLEDVDRIKEHAWKVRK